MADHDHSYKLLFSHPEMIRDLLEGFVKADWLAELDYGSLEKVGGSYVTDDLRDRASDIVWRARWGKEWIYIYLLIEFLCGAPHKNSCAESPVMRRLYQVRPSFWVVWHLLGALRSLEQHRITCRY